MRELATLGKKIYRMDNPRERRRFVVFMARAAIHRGKLKALLAWFREDGQRQQLLQRNPFPVEQVTRAFFYRGSTLDSRIKLVKEHYLFLQQKLQEEAMLGISATENSQPYALWSDEYDGEPWHAVLRFSGGQRKEGLLSLVLSLGKDALYQMMFWFARNKAGEDCLYIGAMQGPNREDAREIIKQITKRCYGYRTKNLILYLTQAVARVLDVRHIYAVTNDGYYANNHLRANRKLKTDFGAFWQEAGGFATEDSRFDELPLTEPRKSIEEVKSQKRNLYRKRFALLDAIDAIVESNMRKILRKGA